MKVVLKEIIFCTKCLNTFKNPYTRIRFDCPKCGNIIDTRNRKGYKAPSYDNRLKLFKEYISDPDNIKRNRDKGNRNRRLRVLLIIGKGEIKCFNCGCTNSDLIEINHINGKGAIEYREKGSVRFYYEIINFKRNIDDLNLLCKVCNALHYLELKYGKLPYSITWNGINENN